MSAGPAGATLRREEQRVLNARRLFRETRMRRFASEPKEDAARASPSGCARTTRKSVLIMPSLAFTGNRRDTLRGDALVIHMNYIEKKTWVLC